MSETVRTIYESNDLTFLAEQHPTLQEIPRDVRGVHGSASVLANDPSHSAINTLFETAKRTPEIHFIPPPGYKEGRYTCFSSSILKA